MDFYKLKLEGSVFSGFLLQGTEIKLLYYKLIKNGHGIDTHEDA